jgi:hypothetical protein
VYTYAFRKMTVMNTGRIEHSDCLVIRVLMIGVGVIACPGGLNGHKVQYASRHPICGLIDNLC